MGVDAIGAPECSPALLELSPRRGRSQARGDAALLAIYPIQTHHLDEPNGLGRGHGRSRKKHQFCLKGG